MYVSKFQTCDINVILLFRGKIGEEMKEWEDFFRKGVYSVYLYAVCEMSFNTYCPY